MRFDRMVRAHLRAGGTGLTEIPPKGDIKMLQGYKDGKKRLRVGKYRIVFEERLSENIETLLIINIDSRGDIYK